MIGRRSFIGAILAAGVAPAFARSGSLWVPSKHVVDTHGQRFGMLTAELVDSKGNVIKRQSIAHQMNSEGWNRVGATFALDRGHNDVAGLFLTGQQRQARSLFIAGPVALTVCDILNVTFDLAAPV